MINKWASILGKAIHTIFTVGTAAGLAFLKVEVPFFNLPIISQVTDALVKAFGSKLDKLIQNDVTFLVIDFQTAEQKKAYVASVERLRLAQQGENPLEKERARLEFRKKLVDLISWDGTYTP